jgi:hypothetical protein
MSAATKFILRAALSVGAAFAIAYFYFGGIDWSVVLPLAGFMLVLAYVFEALRGRGSGGSGGSFR